jgi:hypothetical protein
MAREGAGQRSPRRRRHACGKPAMRGAWESCRRRRRRHSMFPAITRANPALQPGVSLSTSPCALPPTRGRILGPAPLRAAVGPWHAQTK